MTDQDHADAIRKAAEALNAAIEAAQDCKVFASVMTIDATHLTGCQPTTQVLVSVVKAI